jgi:tetrahydromethanopterin S-methyltransferase subunit G
MSDAVLIAVVSSCTAILSGVISGTMASKLTIYRIDQLEKKVDKHNGLVERMVVVEQSTKSAHHRLDDIVKGVKA